MLVVTRNGSKHLVTDGFICYTFDMYTENLTDIDGDIEYDIMAIYPKPKNGRRLSYDLSVRGEPIWIREEEANI